MIKKLAVFICLITTQSFGEITAGNPKDMVPGQPLLLEYNLPIISSSFKIVCEQKLITSITRKNKIFAFIAVPYKFKKEKFSCELINTKTSFKKIILNVNIKKIKYKTSYIKVPKRKVDLKKSDLEWYLKDKEILKNVYSNTERIKVYFNKPFHPPLNSKITSPYGAKRIFNNKKSSWHNGIDFRAKVGTPIPSTNRGKVVLVRHLFFNGKTVIVDHGMNILSLYCHLSDYKVKVGDIVEQGSVVGLGGNTGRSSGPHLHWGIKLQGEWVNGLTLVEESQSISKELK